MIHQSPSAARARSWSAEELENELGRVHAREFARLLCRAALPLDFDPAAWRRAARRARSLAEIDGFELPGALRHALGHPPAEWPEPASLVGAALELDRSEETRRHARTLGLLEQREQPPW